MSSSKTSSARSRRVQRLASLLPTTEEIRAERARRARRSLLSWCTYVDSSYQRAAHLRQLAEALERVERGECRRLIVSMPPRHGKSETTSKSFPAWFLGRRPDDRVILASYGAALAYTASREVRNRLAEHGRDVFGVSVASDSSAVDAWALEGRRGGLVAGGVGGPLTGQGADLAIIDDPIKDHVEAFSQVTRERIRDWYRTVLRTRLAPGGRIVLVMTRWHEDDLAGWLAEEENRGAGEQWERIVLPALDDDGSSLWPERFPPAEMEAVRDTMGGPNSYAWLSLYQQAPTNPAGDIFRRDWWQWFTEPPELDEVIQSWDCAFKGSATSDYVVGQVWGRKGAHRYLLDQVRGKLSFVETKNAIRLLSAKWPQAAAKLIEDKANGPAIIDELRRDVPGLVPVEPDGGKEARARAVSPYVEAGNVFLPRDAPWALDLVEECAAFPRGKHDDQVDALTQALRRFAQAKPSPGARLSRWGQAV